MLGTNRLAADLKLFHHLASHNGSLTVARLADMTGASSQLLGELLVLYSLRECNVAKCIVFK